MLSVKNTAALCALSLLVACGGGGGKAGSTPFGSGSGAGTTTGSNAASNSTGTVLVSLSSEQISSSSPGLVTVSARDASGNAITGQIVEFAVSNASLATVSPSSVLLVNGQAQTTIRPVSSSGTGAAYVTATVTVGASDLSARTPFTVSPTTVTLTSATADSVGSLSAYASTGISFVVSGASASVPVVVRVSSTCASAGKAVLSPVSQTLTSTSGSVTYQDKGCAATDQVVVQIDGTSQSRSVSLNVTAPTTRGIEFVSASPDTICIFGSGCVNTSEVTFKVTDENGLAKPNVDVNLTVDQTESAELVSSTAKSDADGLVRVSVKSKTRPGPVRVKAITTGGTTSFQTVSSALAVNAGLPRQSGFSFAAAKYAMNGNLDGDEAELRVQLNDRFGNPVPDGTAISFVAEGGTVVPAACQTVSSVCKVKFMVSNPRPADGRVEVVAYAQGEEDFVDANSNSIYDSGEAVVQQGPVVLDKNENNSMDVSSGERIIGADDNTEWDDNIFVREDRRFYFSITSSAPRLFVAIGSTCTTTPLSTSTINLGLTGTCRGTVDFCIRDANTAADTLGGNPIASDSVVAARTKADGVSVSVSNSPIPKAVDGPTIHQLVVERSSCSEIPESGGSVDLDVTMGGGSTTKFTTTGIADVLN